MNGEDEHVMIVEDVAREMVGHDDATSSVDMRSRPIIAVFSEKQEHPVPEGYSFEVGA